METKYKIIYTGELQPGFEYEDVVSNLISISNMDREKAGNFLSTDKPTLIKQDLDKDKAEKHCALLKKTGLQVQLIRSKNSPSETSTASPTPVMARKRESKIPDAGMQAAESELPKTPKQKRVPDNPYASPKADLNVNKTTTAKWLEKPQKVPSSHGWLWIKEATTMFLAQPWKWMGIALIAGVLLSLFNIIPIVGFIPYALLSMLFGGGLMLTAQSQADGDSIKFSYLFKGFTNNRNQLIVLGLLYLAGFLVIGISMAMLIGIGIWAMFGLGTGNPETAVTAMAENTPKLILAMLVGMALSIPHTMAIWFTPPLVAINDQKAWTAYKLSLQACLKNWLPFLIYSLVFLVIGIVIMAAAGAVSALVVYLIGSNGSFFLAFIPMLIMLLIGFPMTIVGGLSIFTSFKDIFYKSA